jgi:hypothetical protein
MYREMPFCKWRIPDRNGSWPAIGLKQMLRLKIVWHKPSRTTKFPVLYPEQEPTRLAYLVGMSKLGVMTTWGK